MKQEGNTVYADPGKCLKTSHGIFQEVPLGTFKGYKDGKLYQFTTKLKDIQEVTPIRILDEVYYVSATSYGDVVSELIRYKYSLDEELALYANSFIKDNSEAMNKYQEWRVLCKEAAKKICDE